MKRLVPAIVCSLALSFVFFAAGYALGDRHDRPARLSPIYGGEMQELPVWACEELVEWRVSAWARNLHADDRAVREWLGKKAACGS